MVPVLKNILLLLLLYVLKDAIEASKYFNRNNSSPGYLLLTPSSFLSGVNNKVCVSRFGSATLGSATAHIELISSSINSNEKSFRHSHKFIARARKTFTDGNGGCIDISVPKTVYKKASLHLRMRFDSLPNYRVSTRREVRIQQETNLNIIQTDKSIYRGGETVKFRILQLKPDLTPQYSPIYRVYVEAPSDIFGGPVKIAQWFNTSVQMGQIQREYKLDKHARKGDWRIVVDSRDPTVPSTSQIFHVINYDLPKFYLDVKYDKNILVTLKQLRWTVCAKYMYDEATKGTLHINIRTDAYESPNIYFSTLMDDTNGCYNYTLNTQMLGLEENGENETKLVMADVSFQEMDTNIWRNTTVISYIRSNIVNVKFINEDRNYYKPGLPHEVKVKVYDWNENKVSGARVQFCTNINDEIDNMKSSQYQDKKEPKKMAFLSFINDCDSSMTDSEGYASFVFTIPDNMNLEYVYLNAIVLSHPLHDFEFKTDTSKFSSASFKLYSWGNKTNINMEIGNPIKESTNANNIGKCVFPIFVKFDGVDLMRQITLHYLLVTRSGIISSWGVSTQCVSPIHDVQNIEVIFGPSYERNECNDENYSENGVYKMMLSMKESYLMCPYSYLIVYFTRPNGDIIVANKRFQVKNCLPNKITQQWMPPIVSPKSEVILNLQSTGPALCMLKVKNVALNHIVSDHSVYKDVLDKLGEFVDNRYNRIYSESLSNVCFSDHTPKIYDEFTRLYYWNTLKLFLSTGLEIMTDTLPSLTKCPKSDFQYSKNPSEFAIAPYNQSPLKERYFFPETWLWDIRLMDSTGVLNMSVNVPDTITNWESEAFCMTRSGIAATIFDQNSILKVFQPFFVEISAPSVIKRGERIQMYYRIFNYMDQSLPVMFDLEVSPSAAVTIISQERSSSRITCIPKKQSLIVHFTVKAHQLRTINITVMVQAKISMQKMCSAVALPFYQDIRDKVVKEIEVEPEGFPIENHKSALLCVPESTNKTDISWVFERENCVENSENWFISLVGDITGPMTLNAEKLVSTPMGCGEQNMALLAYNLIALEYSIAKKRTSGDVKDAAINNLLLGYQRQLNFRHSDSGAFSAFGRADETGSTWLTAFCLKYLSVLQKKWNIGSQSEVIEMASKWLLDRQMENGCFVNEGQVFHREMKGGLGHETSSIALTAYVIMAILDADINVKPSVIQNTAYCLTALKFDELLSNTKQEYVNTTNNLIYTYTLATLAQLKIEKYLLSHEISIDKHQNKINILEANTDIRKRNENQFSIKMLAESPVNAVSLLKRLAKRNGEFIWWEAGSLSVSIETTAYAILSLLNVGGEENIMFAINAAKWLSTHRNANGGFISTQDTLIAVEALCLLRYAMPDIPPSMNVIVEGPNRARHFTVNPSERHKLHVVMMKAIDSSSQSLTKLKIKVHGKGCLLVQATQTYNKRFDGLQKNSGFNLFVNSVTHGTYNCKDNGTWCMCAAVLEVCVNWNDPTGDNFPEMAIVEVHMPTGYSPDHTLLYQLIKEENILLRRIEESDDGNIIYIYLSTTSQNLSFRPSQCFNIYLVGLKSQTLPALIKVYDYYHTEMATSTTYKIPDHCPSDDRGNPHTESTDIKEETKETNIQNLTDQNWHVIDSDQDLDTPDTMEGVKPVYELPPSNYHFNPMSGDDIEWQNGEEDTSKNWTLMGSEIDLDYTTGGEENEDIWELI